MIERLPLNALRAFAIAARYESFKRAAAQLSVTPGAVGRQVKRLEAGPPLAQPADLAAHTLLHVSWTPGAAATRFPGWREWLDFAGAGDVAAPVHRRYSLFSLALDQAIAGRGMALTTRTVVADRLASGVLVAPFGDRYAMRSPFDYWLVRPASGSPPPLAHRFCDWLRREAEAFARSG
ncbi:MAG: LysR family transcriptional regulator [Salinisphaera sp.]|uniref:LysR family transcriptional regulator n=1 Tax=Salinisphaera sp. TaxID=1914330 RepID=UPI003C7B81D2